MSLSTVTPSGPKAHHCRFCGKRLWLLQRLRKAEFCSDSHRQLCDREQNQLALARLYDAIPSDNSEPHPAKPATAA